MGPIDLWHLHYPDPAVPIEETVAAMSDVVRTGLGFGTDAAVMTECIATSKSPQKKEK